MSQMYRIHLLEGSTISEDLDHNSLDFIADEQNTYAYFTAESLHNLITTIASVDMKVSDVQEGLDAGCNCLMIDHMYDYMGKTVIRFIPDPEATNMTMAPSTSYLQ